MFVIDITSFEKSIQNKNKIAFIDKSKEFTSDPSTTTVSEISFRAVLFKLEAVAI